MLFPPGEPVEAWGGGVTPKQKEQRADELGVFEKGLGKWAGTTLRQGSGIISRVFLKGYPTAAWRMD